MDKEKKEKLVAIVITTLLSLVVSVIACLLGISPDALQPLSDSQAVAPNAIVCMTDDI